MKQEGGHIESEWQRELQAHIAIDVHDHPNIIKFLGAVTRGKRYLLFQWADGGNLRELWHNNPRPILTAALVKDVVKQLHGLSDALATLHTIGNSGGDTSSYRHGDIKPENILRMRTQHVGGSDIDIGQLKIADMGLAKHHTVATELREKPTSMKYTTHRYEPPEVVTDAKANVGRSRRQDIWSFGCVTLELLIWLLHGTEALSTFNDQYLVYERYQGRSTAECPYFETDSSKSEKSVRVHCNVVATIDHLLLDSECSRLGGSAIKDLLQLIKDGLLVVNLATGKTQRASASELEKALATMLVKGATNDGYWYSGNDRTFKSAFKLHRAAGPSTLGVPEDKRGGGRIGQPHQRLPTPPSKEMNVMSLVVPSHDPVTQSRKVR